MIQPLIVTVLLLRFRAGTVTYCDVPLSARPPLNSPVVHVGLLTSVPARPLPDESAAVVPLPSSKRYQRAWLSSVALA